MNTPQNKRNIEAVSPASVSESPEEKRQQGMSDSTESNMAALNIDEQLGSEDKFENAPKLAIHLNDNIKKVHKEVSKINARFDRLEATVALVDKKSESALAVANECFTVTEQLSRKVLELSKENKKLSDEIQQMNDYSRRENLRIDGISEIVMKVQMTYWRKWLLYLKIS